MSLQLEFVAISLYSVDLSPNKPDLHAYMSNAEHLSWPVHARRSNLNIEMLRTTDMQKTALLNRLLLRIQSFFIFCYLFRTDEAKQHNTLLCILPSNTKWNDTTRQNKDIIRIYSHKNCFKRSLSFSSSIFERKNQWNWSDFRHQIS